MGPVRSLFLPRGAKRFKWAGALGTFKPTHLTRKHGTSNTTGWINLNPMRVQDHAGMQMQVG